MPRDADLKNSVQDYLTLVRNTFRELSLQPVEEISFLLPRFPASSTELHFDKSTTWYRLGPAILESFNRPPRVLGVQCRTLFLQAQTQGAGAATPTFFVCLPKTGEPFADRVNM